MLDIFSKTILHLAEVPGLKGVLAFGLTFLSFMLGTVYNEAVLATAMLLIIDAVTGMIAARFFEKQQITSKRFSHSVVKALVYFLAISASKFLDQTIPGDLVQYSTISFVAGTEFISILENIGRMGIKTPKKLLNTLKEKFESESKGHTKRNRGSKKRVRKSQVSAE